MNRRNNWEGLRDLANKDLQKVGAMIMVHEPEEEGFYDIDILYGLDFDTKPFDITKYDVSENYASNYYEDELSDVINDAWSYAKKEAEHEALRRRLSAACSYFDATEEKPLNCDVENGVQLHIQGIDEEAQGLSEAEKPQVTGVFHDPEGIVWVTIKYYNEPIEADNLLNVSLQQILDWISEKFQMKF